MKLKSTLLCSAIAGILCSQTVLAAPSQDEMWQMMLDMKKQNAALLAEVQKLKGQQAETNEKLEVTATAIEETGNRVNKTVDWFERTTIGGYGEIHYNNLHDSDGNDFEEIDIHRIILEVSHRFTDDIRFFTEIEFEHAVIGDAKGGEVVVEQAYLDFDLNDNHTARVGAFLIPVGILNETHEPPTFYGVERNIVESEILPTTWTEGGAGLIGQLGGGFSYGAYVHSGLEVGADQEIRNGREKVADAEARDWAFTGRLKYTGISGLELAATLQYQEDISQDNTAGLENSEALLFAAHAIYTTGPLTVKALYASWEIDNETFEAANTDHQYGWYVEPSWKLFPKWGIFARYSDLARAENAVLRDLQQIDVGFNYYPHENVVFKGDYQVQQAEDGQSEQDGFNLGIGYQF